MREALASYFKAIDGSYAFAVGRFVCPAEKLRELGAELSRLEDVPTIPLAVVGRVALTAEDWEPARVADADDMNAFMDDAEELADIEAYEVTLPKVDGLEEHLNDLNAFSEVEVCVGLPWEEDLTEALALVSDADFAIVQGQEPVSYAQAARFIHGCDALELPFKISGRFAQPFSDGKHLGALNVLAAGALVTSEDLSSKQVEQVLSANADAFQFGNDALIFGEYKATLNAIDESRELLAALSVGSLELLKWLSKAR